MLLSRGNWAGVRSKARRCDSNPDRDQHGHHHEHSHSDRLTDSDDDGHDHDNPDRDNHVHAYDVADAVHSSNFHVHAIAHLYIYALLDPNADQYTHSNVYAVADGDPHGYTDAYIDAFPNAMTDILPFLKSLMSEAGLSAYETPVARVIEKKWNPLVDEISTSRLGSLHALKRGKGKGKHSTIMIATHMDAIGLMINGIVEEFLHVDEVGGIDPRILPGTPVMVHGRRDLPGVVVMPPAKSLADHGHNEAVGLPNLLVDVGLTAAQVKRLVQVGDIVSFDTKPVDMAGETISGHSLDNRASVAALTVCLEGLQGKSHTWDVWAVATAQEEETLGGAATSAFHLQPDLAVVIDVTFAKGPGANSWQTFPMGKGPTLGWGANLHPYLYERCKELAERLEIPVSTDISPAYSGTDAHAIQVAREGIPTMLLGIPLRYMHTPVEMVAVKDVLRAGRLLAEFICELEPDFVSEITWEDKSAE